MLFPTHLEREREQETERERERDPQKSSCVSLPVTQSNGYHCAGQACFGKGGASEFCSQVILREKESKRLEEGERDPQKISCVSIPAGWSSVFWERGCVRILFPIHLEREREQETERERERPSKGLKILIAMSDINCNSHWSLPMSLLYPHWSLPMSCLTSCCTCNDSHVLLLKD
jgi:hypothetical protein